MMNSGIPLAERMRPHKLEEVVGQSHLAGPNGVLRNLLHSGHLPSIIFWGPPGTGKTETIGNIAKHLVDYGLKVFVTAPTHTAINNCLNVCGLCGKA